MSGVVLIALCFVLPMLPRCRWGGLRFSYTLADDEVWRKVHLRFRWAFPVLGAVCFWPFRTLPGLIALSAVLVTALMATIVASYVCARRLYREKFGTTEVVTTGFLKYEPPRAPVERGEED